MSGPTLFDRAQLKHNLDRAFDRAEPGSDFLLGVVAEDLSDRLAPLSRSFENAVELSLGLDRIRQTLVESGKVEKVYCGHLFSARKASKAPDFIFDDAVPPLKDQSVGLITSALTLHWVNDLPGGLVQIRKALIPDGLFLGTLLGGGTLNELRDVMMRAELEVTGGAAPRISPFADIKEIGALLQRAGFALPVADADRITVRYDNLFALMKDLRAMGATSALTERSRKPLNRSILLRAAELYANDYSDPDGRIRATFNLVSVSGWSPHESQQKPLKPGSAKTSLADALNKL
ncbi:MAG: methyltransferase domain-containing protein [Rhodobacteraceae bacterium]|nr:methyltransferase domain-containing protein [Paracoccaceae bacterium]